MTVPSDRSFRLMTSVDRRYWGFLNSPHAWIAPHRRAVSHDDVQTSARSHALALRNR
jgi:hypothetical protein